VAIAEGYKANFETLRRAVTAGHITLVECTDAKTGLPVMAVCAVNRVGRDVELAPLARLFDGNPYEELLPPTAEAA
jgi:hypothetical protein